MGVLMIKTPLLGVYLMTSDLWGLPVRCSWNRTQASYHRLPQTLFCIFLLSRIKPHKELIGKLRKSWFGVDVEYAKRGLGPGRPAVRIGTLGSNADGLLKLFQGDQIQ